MTIPEAVDKLIAALIAGTGQVKEGFVEGLYLTGSISLQDYQPSKSDIDFLILCKDFPAHNVRLQLRALHRRLEQGFEHSNLSGLYLTVGGLNVLTADRTQVLHYHQGHLRDGTFDMAPITLYELKTTALTITGIPAQQLPVTIHINDVYGFLFRNINTYWKAWVDKHAAVNRPGILLMLLPRLTEWVILGLARQLYTLRTGEITSKTAAGHYCLEHLPANYHWIVERAIKIRTAKNEHFLELKPSYSVQPSIKRAVQTLDCAYFIIDQFNNEYHRLRQNSR